MTDDIRRLIDGVLRKRGYKPSALHGSEFYEDFEKVAEAVLKSALVAAASKPPCPKCGIRRQPGD